MFILRVVTEEYSNNLDKSSIRFKSLKKQALQPGRNCIRSAFLIDNLTGELINYFVQERANND